MLDFLAHRTVRRKSKGLTTTAPHPFTVVVSWFNSSVSSLSLKFYWHFFIFFAVRTENRNVADFTWVLILSWSHRFREQLTEYRSTAFPFNLIIASSSRNRTAPPRSEPKISHLSIQRSISSPELARPCQYVHGLSTAQTTWNPPIRVSFSIFSVPLPGNTAPA